MKRALISLCLVLSMTVPLSAPAQAIFGLSGCEKAKKEISPLESKMIKYINGVRGDYYTNNISGYDQKLFILTKQSISNIDRFQKEDLIPQIWKVAFNNPKCFTNTQKLRITELRKLLTPRFISYYVVDKYINSNYCKGADSYIHPQQKKMKDCFLESVTVLGNYSEYKSIYSY